MVEALNIIGGSLLRHKLKAWLLARTDASAVEL